MTSRLAHMHNKVSSSMLSRQVSLSCVLQLIKGKASSLTLVTLK